MDDNVMMADELREKHGVVIIYDPILGEHRLKLMDNGQLAELSKYTYPTELDARRAATAIVRGEQGVKVERKIEKLTYEGMLHPTDWYTGEPGDLEKANLYRITDPDGTVRVVQKLPDDFAPVVEYWSEHHYKLWGMHRKTRAAYNATQLILRDQRAIRGGGVMAEDCPRCGGTGEEVVEYIGEYPRAEPCGSCREREAMKVRPITEDDELWGEHFKDMNLYEITDRAGRRFVQRVGDWVLGCMKQSAAFCKATGLSYDKQELADQRAIREAEK